MVGLVFELGAALVLGENIGTTITANLAALTANTQARRAALAHLVFNVLGLLGIMPFQSCNYGGFMVCRRYNENSRSGCCRIF